jgi:hypothetical protein
MLSSILQILQSRSTRVLLLMVGCLVFPLCNLTIGNSLNLDLRPKVPTSDAPHQDHPSSRPKYNPTFLWGISTTKEEVERRQTIRETYLSFYKNSREPNRICSLSDVQKQKVPLEDCQLVYVFFVGGNPDGPTELVNPSSTFPITVENATIKEEDVVSLNIRENLEDGKSQTWFKYASMVADVFPVDYIAKVDSDTLLFTPTFLKFAYRRLRRNKEYVYGGIAMDEYSCDPNITEDHSCPLPLTGPLYMSGEVYFMSPDLAKCITSSQVNRSSLTIRHEDVDIGNFVHSCPEELRIVKIDRSKVLRNRMYNADWDASKKFFTGTFWGHSLASSGGYFKYSHHIRKTWRQFQAYCYLQDVRAKAIGSGTPETRLILFSFLMILQNAGYKYIRTIRLHATKHYYSAGKHMHSGRG